VSAVVGWGIVGLGRIAERIAVACSQAENARLAAVCSRDRLKAVGFAGRHSVPCSYGSYEDMLADTAVDAVYISSPNALHAPQAIAAAHAGKHVFCEKPMALTVRECEEMIAACRQVDVRLGVGYHLRQHPAHREIRKLVASGDLGEVQLARVHFFVGTQYDRGGWKAEPDIAGGGAVMSAGVHALDLLRFLVGQEVVEVSAFADALPVEEIVTCLVRFQRGAQAYMDTARIVPFASSRNDVLVYGTSASAVALGTLGGRATGRLEITTVEGTTAEDVGGRDLYAQQIEEFGRCVREGGEPSATGLDGLRTVEITEALYASARTGSAVRVGA
jgi:1,5-anhydro-D-fructose reductase (1,5-anhydro-D-mannitol-forming)